MTSPLPGSPDEEEAVPHAAHAARDAALRAAREAADAPRGAPSATTASSSDAAPTSGARGRGRPRDEGADDRILDAAAELMLERGVGDVRVEEIAEHAGVGKATVYRRFPTKDAMAAAALSRMFGRRIPIPDTGSFRSDMEAVYVRTIEFASSRQGWTFIRLAAAAAGRSRRAADVYREAYEARRDQFGVVIDRALSRGELTRDLDRPLFLDSLPALLLFRAVTNQALPSVDQVPQLIDGILRALDETADGA